MDYQFLRYKRRFFSCFCSFTARRTLKTQNLERRYPRSVYTRGVLEWNKNYFNFRILHQELIKTLQKFILDLTQRLHKVEVERRDLRIKVNDVEMENVSLRKSVEKRQAEEEKLHKDMENMHQKVCKATTAAIFCLFLVNSTYARIEKQLCGLLLFIQYSQLQ